MAFLMKEFMELVHGKNWHFSLFRESRLTPLIHALGGEFESRKGMDHRVFTASRVRAVRAAHAALPADAKRKYRLAMDYLEAELNAPDLPPAARPRLPARPALVPLAGAALAAPLLQPVLAAVPALPGLQGVALLPRTWNFRHVKHGSLCVTRRIKTAQNREVYFDLRLRAPGGGNSQTICQMAVSNDDGDAAGTMGPRTSVGYGDINLADADMDGMGIGYLVHKCMCESGEEIGVNLFVVASVTTEQMAAALERGGMGAGSRPNSYQHRIAGYHHSWMAQAQRRGWKPA